MTEALNPSENLRFDSAELAPLEAFARYRLLYGGGSDARAIGGTFAARVRAWRLDRAVLFDRRLDGVMHARGSDRAGQDGFDHFTLTLVRGGHFEVYAGKGFVAVPVGEAVLLDMLQPMANRSEQAHIVTISLARDRMTAILGATDRLHGRILDAGRTGLLGDYVDALTQRLDALDPRGVVAATEALVLLVAIALDAPAPRDEGMRRDAERAVLLRAIIDAGLDDPDFSIDQVARLSGLSRSTLYRVLGDRGGVAGLIQDRRFERLRQALIDPGDTRSFAALALDTGFTSESHCSRGFLDRFGMRPGEYRRAHGLPEEAGDPVRQMYRFHDEIR